MNAENNIAINFSNKGDTYFIWLEWIFSPVKIRFDPEQIPRKHFMIFSITIVCGEHHTKSLPKSDHHKGPNYDVIKQWKLS